ncbi:MAG: SNF2-related protein [Pyramidobacter sp.]|mgnify:CR=1 FL=1
MIYQPHPYQEYATKRILEQEAVGLFLDLGLGKTVATLTAIDQLLYDFFEVSKVLVIAPLRVAQKTWPDEVKKWDHLRHLRISKVLGSEKQRMAALQAQADIWIINRENVEWLVDLYGKDWPFDMVVIDELSSFKSPKARRFRALRKVRPMIKRIVGLTGTPAPNGLIDLWPQIYLLDQGKRLGKTVTGYRSRYFEPGKRNRTVIFTWDPKPGAEEAIYKQLEDLCVSMSADDWLHMPERIDRVIEAQLSEEAQVKYDQLERDMLLPFTTGDVTADSMAVLSNKLLQLANGAVYDENGAVQEIHQAKIDALDDVLEAANGQPVLVFYAYRHDRDRLLAHIPTARELETEQDIDDWNQGKIQVLLAHPASAGHGLNLQAGGHIIVWFGLTWSLELYQQANARLYRQGQEKSVIIHHLVAVGTIDEDVMKVLAGKEVSQKALLEAIKARIALLAA